MQSLESAKQSEQNIGPLKECSLFDLTYNLAESESHSIHVLGLEANKVAY